MGSTEDGNNSWVLTLPADERATLTYANGPKEYTHTHRDGTKELFNQNGYLIQLIDRNGNITNIAYNALNRVSTVTDAANRVLTFTYPQGSTLVSSIQYPTGTTIASYTYDTGRLASVTYSGTDGTTVTYQYDSATSLLLNVLDEQGKVLEAHTYDDDRRGTTRSGPLVL